MRGRFRVGITRTLLAASGKVDLAAVGLEALAADRGVDWRFLDEQTPEITPTQARGFNALIIESTRLSAASLAEATDLAIVARYGAGYDVVDLDACTRSGVIVSNAPDGTQHPMATVNLAFLLALSLRLPLKDRLVREGRWDEWPEHMGVGLTGRTFGLVGMGAIGRETLRLVAPLGMRVLVHDPLVADGAVRLAGGEPASLATVLREADVVCLSVPLTPSTHHLIGADQLRVMKRTAFLINAARGPIVDQAALTRALGERWIEGAALDVFEVEPIRPDDPLVHLDNVILAPHALGATDECFALIGRSACRSVLAVARGETPQFVVNREVLENPLWQSKLEAWRAASMPHGASVPKED